MVKRSSAPDLKKRSKEWYYAPNGQTRIRYRYCGYCKYKTTGRVPLEKHVKKHHSFKDVVNVPELPEKRRQTRQLTRVFRYILFQSINSIIIAHNNHFLTN